MCISPEEEACPQGDVEGSDSDVEHVWVLLIDRIDHLLLRRWLS